MSVSQVANGLAALCREGRFLDAVDRYYSDDIVSVEPIGSPEMPAEQKGIEAVKGKNEWWVENHEVHELAVRGPYIGDEGFAVHFNLDVTAKMTGDRMQFQEVALYTVRNGKIVREEFYYNMPGA